MELRDHSRNQRCPSPVSAAPSFSGRRLRPDLRRKATNCPGLTSRPSHCCSLTSPAPPLPAEPELLSPGFQREARPWAPIGHRPSPQPITVASGMEHRDWPGPGHVTRLSRTPVSCSSCISAGDSGSTSHWSLDQRVGSSQVGSIPAVGVRSYHFGFCIPRALGAGPTVRSGKVVASLIGTELVLFCPRSCPVPFDSQAVPLTLTHGIRRAQF